MGEEMSLLDREIQELETLITLQQQKLALLQQSRRLFLAGHRCMHARYKYLHKYPLTPTFRLQWDSAQLHAPLPHIGAKADDTFMFSKANIDVSFPFLCA
jgi:hypothetical protein